MRNFGSLSFVIYVMMIMVTSANATGQEQNTKSAVFALGCFWCAEHDYMQVPGVIDVKPGYTGGTMKNPTYRNHEGHREAVKIIYDPERVTYRELLRVFWDSHDPFDAKGQFCDRGPSYLAGIFPATDGERKEAELSRSDVEKTYGRAVITPILPPAVFWEAEAYHDDYAEKNPLSYQLYRFGCGRDQRLKDIRAE